MVPSRIVFVGMLAGIFLIEAPSFAGTFQVRTSPGSLIGSAGMHYESDGNGNYIVRSESGAARRPNRFDKGTTYSRTELLRLMETQHMTQNDRCIDELRQAR